jgi:hypothetical protein
VAEMIDQRLLTSGCSFTEYCWNTWADYLGKEYSEFENLGAAGGDNPTVAKSIVQNAKPGDMVVALWTSFDRWSRWSEEIKPIPRDNNNHWIRTGTFLFDKTLMMNYYHPVERFLNTMDSIQLVDLHSQKVGYTVYHFTAFPLFLGQLETDAHPTVLEFYKNYSIKNNFLNEISMQDFKIQTNQDIRTTHKYTTNDSHPTPKVQWEYLTQIIVPKIGITLSNTTVDDVSKDQTNVLNGIVY